MIENNQFFPDPMQFELTRNDVWEFIGLVAQNVYQIPDIVDTIEKAGLQGGTLHLGQSARRVWTDAFIAAGKAGRLRLLLSQMEASDSYFFCREHIHQFLAGERVAVAPPAQRSTALSGERWKGGKEARTSPRSGLVDIPFLSRGLAAAKSVVRLGLQTQLGSSYGTGFLIAPNRVLTNHHVLFETDGTRASNVVIYLDHEMGEDGHEHIGGAIAALDETIRGDKALDWAVVDLTKDISGAPLLKFAKDKPKKGDYVSIIQHPFGGTKKIALFNNEVRFVDDTYLQYLTDTESGSSGSPVFNTRWEVVALHHSWVPATEERMQVRNEGILMERVVDALKANELLK